MVLDEGAEAWLPALASAGIPVTFSEPNGPWAGTVADGYEFSSSEFERWSREAPPLVVLDDFLAPPPCAHLALNFAAHLSGNMIGPVPALLGPSFALIEEKYRRRVIIRRDVDRVLVTCGARDSNNATTRVIHALTLAAELSGFRPAVEIVLGPSAPHYGVVKSTASRVLPEARLLGELPDLSAAYARADLVIGAGGVSLLERMAMGLPSLTIATAANQALAIEGAAQRGGTLFVGALEDISEQELAQRVVALAADFPSRCAMSECAASTIDGHGASRVAEVLTRMASGRVR